MNLMTGDQMNHELRLIKVWSSLDLNICRIWDDAITQRRDFNVEMLRITMYIQLESSDTTNDSRTFILRICDDKYVKCQNMTCSFKRSLKEHSTNFTHV